MVWSPFDKEGPLFWTDKKNRTFSLKSTIQHTETQKMCIFALKNNSDRWKVHMSLAKPGSRARRTTCSGDVSRNGRSRLWGNLPENVTRALSYRVSPANPNLHLLRWDALGEGEGVLPVLVMIGVKAIRWRLARWKQKKWREGSGGSFRSSNCFSATLLRKSF